MNDKNTSVIRAENVRESTIENSEEGSGLIKLSSILQANLKTLSSTLNEIEANLNAESQFDLCFKSITVVLFC